MGGEERIWEVERVSKAEFPRASKIRKEHPCRKLEEIQQPIKVVNPTHYGKLRKYLYVLCLHALFESPHLHSRQYGREYANPPALQVFFVKLSLRKDFHHRAFL